MQEAVRGNMEVTGDMDSEGEVQEVEAALVNAGVVAEEQLRMIGCAKMLELVWMEFRIHIGLPYW